MTRTAHDIEQTAARHRVQIFIACRDAGHGITARRLGREIAPAAMADMAAELTRFADHAQAIVHSEHHPAVDCQEGCSYCCRKPGVLVSVPELVRLLDYVQRTCTDAERDALKARAAVYVEQVAGRDFNAPVQDSVPCPLLVNHRCSAYSARPLTCRGYNSLSVDACRNAHRNPRVQVPMFTVLRDVTDGTTVGAAQALKAAGINDAMVDLGTALHIALNAGDDFVKTLLQGDRSLAAAEEPQMLDELWTRVCRTARQVGVVADPARSQRHHA